MNEKNELPQVVAEIANVIEDQIKAGLISAPVWHRLRSIPDELRTALSTLTAQGGEAVAWTSKTSFDSLQEPDGVMFASKGRSEYRCIPLYTTPPAPSSSAVDVEWALSVLDREIAATGAQSFDQTASDLMKLRGQIKALASTAASGGECDRPWRDMYRIERAMRFMDNGLTRADAFAAVDKELAAASAHGDGDGK